MLDTLLDYASERSSRTVACMTPARATRVISADLSRARRVLAVRSSLAGVSRIERSKPPTWTARPRH